VHRVRRQTVLERSPCDIKKLSLSALQGFLLSLVDGRLTVADIAEMQGMTLAQLFPHADHLLQVGAVRIVGEPAADARATAPPPASTAPRSVRKDTKTLAPPRRESRSVAAVRRDSKATIPPRRTKAPPPDEAPPSRRTPPPRSHKTRSTAQMQAQRGPSPRPTQPTRPAARVSEAPAPSSPPSRSSSRSTPPSSPPTSRPSPGDAPASLDPAALERILAFEARLVGSDHYAILGVERTAEKAVVKRAYFALASEFHPDRHFGKKLGKVAPVLQRIFERITAAHDVLSNRAKRAEYDATLAPVDAPSTPPATATATATATAASTPGAAAPRAGEPAVTAKRSTRKMKAVRPRSDPALRATDPAQQAASPADLALFRFYRARKRDSVRRRVAVFVKAADDAVQRNDLVTAASHYRMALQNDDDPIVAAKLAAIRGASDERLYGVAIARARLAEKDGRWAEAATFFTQANAARPDPSTAERAANALRLSGGDLHHAVQLAEQATLAEPANPDYRVTLGEVCMAAKLVKRAAAEVERALVIEPSNARAKALAASLALK
jgi:tetratricopeptide (TPR) repeat protein